MKTAYILIALGVLFGVAAAHAADPPIYQQPGVDLKVLPEELTIFMAETVDLGAWPETTLHDVMDKAGIPNLGWLEDRETHLKTCRRGYAYIQDKAAGGISPAMTPEQGKAILDVSGLTEAKVLPLHPDATKPTVCSIMGMMTPQLMPGTKWYNYKVACPARVLDERGQTKFAEPACPSDCTCVDEPVKM